MQMWMPEEGTTAVAYQGESVFLEGLTASEGGWAPSCSRGVEGRAKIFTQ